MKQLFILFIGILFCNAGSAQDIISAFKSGNATEIATYFDMSVEITISEKSTTHNKKKGEEVLRNFFKEIGVKNFEVLHKSGTASAQYFIGNLSTNAGVYRTTIYLKQKDNKNLLQEIRFEK